MVAEHEPHCVLFDIDMPGIDGSELSKRLRDAHGDDLILVAVTGWSDKDRASPTRSPVSTTTSGSRSIRRCCASCCRRFDACGSGRRFAP